MIVCLTLASVKKSATKPHKHTLCNCGTRANFALEGQKASCCAKCKTAGMVDVKNKKCRCKKSQPHFGFFGERPTCCASCKTTDMVAMMNKSCKCGIRAAFGLPGNKPSCCKNCKTDDMVDVVSPKCKCGRVTPTFGYPEDMKAVCCVRCKTASMEDVNSQRCVCKRCRPNFGLPGAKATCCATCATEGMTNLNAPRCKQEHCDTIVVGGPNDGYCIRCFIFLFPDKPTARFYKVKERHVADFVSDLAKVTPELHNIEIVYDRQINGECSSRRRPDIRLELLTHSVIIEVDEKKHNSYSCENKRIMQIYQDLGMRPTVFLRLNPDAYTDAAGVKHPSCFKLHRTQEVPLVKDKEVWQARLNVLKERLLFHAVTVPEPAVTTEMLFYEGFADGCRGS